MSDIMTPEQRSRCMSHIHSKNTKPEILVRKELFRRGYRYRINVNNLPGKPDIVLPKYKTVIFVNGCFWHGHEGCKYFVLPKTNAVFWENKIRQTQQRDASAILALHNIGWKIIVIWECELLNEVYAKTIKKIIKMLN